MSDLPEQKSSHFDAPAWLSWLVFFLGLLAITALVLWFVFSRGSGAGPGPKFAPWAPLP